MKLLVYGSLRYYCVNDAAKALRQSAELIGEIRLPGFSLYSVGGWYPGIVADPDNVVGVVCDLYEITDPTIFGPLNAYEGYNPLSREGSLFVREVVTYSPGEEAFIYVYNKEPVGIKIESGDWRDRE